MSLDTHSLDGSFCQMLLCQGISLLTLSPRRPCIYAFPSMWTALMAHNLLRYKDWNMTLNGCDHSSGKCCEKWAWWLVCLDPYLTRRCGSLGHSLLLNKQTEQFTSCTSVPNNYFQYFSTQRPIVYYTRFTVSTLTSKSVFCHTHVIHLSLNDPVMWSGFP